MGLANLCEFIEDCEHTSLAVRILHLLGEEGPRASNPSKYIRFVYNRVILEAATIRAAAVTTLARFGALCEDLKPNILVLLGRICLDSDDEVYLHLRCSFCITLPNPFWNFRSVTGFYFIQDVVQMNGILTSTISSTGNKLNQQF